MESSRRDWFRRLAAGLAAGSVAKEAIAEQENIQLPGILSVIECQSGLQQSPALEKRMNQLDGFLVYTNAERDVRLYAPAEEVFRLTLMKSGSIISDRYRAFDYRHPIISQIAKHETAGCSSKEGAAQRLLDFVHSYVSDADMEAEDASKHPVVTLVRRYGDCEGLTALFGSLVKAAGIDFALLYFSSHKYGEPSHVMGGVAGDFHGAYYLKNSRRYFPAETTGTLFFERPEKRFIGRLPSQFDGKIPTVYVI